MVEYSFKHAERLKNQLLPDGKVLHQFDVKDIPTELIQPLVYALTMESLGRAGIKYDYSEMERKYGVGIDYFRALEQAVNAGKRLIENDPANDINYNDRVDALLGRSQVSLGQLDLFSKLH